MARTYTPAQRVAVSAQASPAWLKIELEDPDLLWRDVSVTLMNGIDAVNTLQLSEDIDSNAERMVASVLRDSGNKSLSPLMTASPTNRNAAGAYAPMLELRRRWRASVAAIGSNRVPIAAEYVEIGIGYVDRIDIDDPSPEIHITGRDLGAVLLDSYIQTERTYGSVGGVAIATVIQQMIDDNAVDNGYLPSGSGGPTVYVPVATTFLVNTFKQPKGNLMQAINAVAAKDDGSVFKYRYDAANVSRPTLFKPNRAAAVETFSIGPDEYLNIPLNSLDLDGVRTVVRIRFVDAAGVIQTVQSPSSIPPVSTAITRYGLRVMEIDLSGDDSTNTLVKAQALADVIRTDTETPSFEQQIESYNLWFVQLGDYVKTLANGVHYDTDQFGGVTSIVKSFARGEMRVTVGLKGKPAGRYRTWTAEAAAGGVIQPPPPPSAPYPPQMLAVPNNTESDDTTRAYALGFVAGSGGGGANLTWTLYQKIGFASETVVNSGNGTALPLLATITRHPRSDKAYRFVGLDVATGLSDTVQFTVPSARPEVTDTGLDLTSGVKESGGKTVNRLLAKSLAADVDNADSVLAGVVRRIPVVGASDATGNMDFGGTGWVTANRNAANLRRSSGDATAVSTIVGQLANTGHATSTFQESGGKLINRLYAKALAADPDNLDSVGNGTTYGRPLASRLSVGKPLIDFSEAIHIAKNLDNIPDTGIRFAAPVPNATSDVRLVATGGVAVAGNNAIKSSGNDTTWDGQVYSLDGYTGGAYASGVATAGQGYTMWGFNTDPTTDASYLSIDYAIYCRGDGFIGISENSIILGVFGSWVADDVLAVTYDGSNIRYLQNGTVLRTVAVGAGIKFFFDSSFFNIATTPSQIKNIRFGPMSSNNAAALGAGNLITGINESSGVAVNRLLAKALAADPNTLDSAVDGITFKKIVSVNGSGQITPPSSAARFGAKVRKSAGMNVGDLAVVGLVVLQWDTEDFDSGGCHDNVTNNTRITVPAGGAIGGWLLIGQVNFPGNATGIRLGYIRKNGGTFKYGYDYQLGFTYNTVGPVLHLFGFDPSPSVGDYYEVAVSQDSGVSLQLLGETFFSAHHLW